MLLRLNQRGSGPDPTTASVGDALWAISPSGNKRGVTVVAVDEARLK
eukprot:gene10758-46938_t